MTTTTITRIYTSYDQASKIVSELEAAGISSSDISLLSSGTQHEGLSPYNHVTETDEKITYDTAITTGGIAGGVGLLASLGLIAIPGLGALAAAGWLAATLGGFAIGAAAGGTVGAVSEALDKHGIDKDTADRSAAAISAGNTLVAVRCDSSQLGICESIMGTSDEVLGSNSASTRSVA